MATRVEEYLRTYSEVGQAPVMHRPEEPRQVASMPTSRASPEIMAPVNAPFVTERMQPRYHRRRGAGTRLFREICIPAAEPTERAPPSSFFGSYQRLPSPRVDDRELDLERKQEELAKLLESAKIQEALATEEVKRYRAMTDERVKSLPSHGLPSTSPSTSTELGRSPPHQAMNKAPATARPSPFDRVRMAVAEEREHCFAIIDGLVRAPTPPERTGLWVEAQRQLWQPRVTPPPSLRGDRRLEGASSVRSEHRSESSPSPPRDDPIPGIWQEEPYPKKGKKLEAPPPPDYEREAFLQARQAAMMEEEEAKAQARASAVPADEADNLLEPEQQQLQQDREWLIQQVRQREVEKLELERQVQEMANARNQQNAFLQNLGRAMQTVQAPPIRIVQTEKDGQKEQPLYPYKIGLDWDVFARSFLERAAFNHWDDDTIASKLRFSLDQKAMETAVHADPSIVDDFDC